MEEKYFQARSPWGATGLKYCSLEGVVEMMLDATQRFTLSLTEKRLFGWHAALFPTGYSGSYVIEVGRQWRTFLQYVEPNISRTSTLLRSITKYVFFNSFVDYADWLS